MRGTNGAAKTPRRDDVASRPARPPTVPVSGEFGLKTTISSLQFFNSHVESGSFNVQLSGGFSEIAAYLCNLPEVQLQLLAFTLLLRRDVPIETFEPPGDDHLSQFIPLC